MPRQQQWARRLGLLTIFLCLATSIAFAGPFEDAQTKFKARDYQGALTLLQQAQQQTPDDTRIYAAMGQTYRRLNDPEDARKAFDQLVRLDPTLRSIPDKASFAKAYVAVGGDTSQFSQNSDTTSVPAVNTSPDDMIRALSSGDLYIAPDMQSSVNVDALKLSLLHARPTLVKLVVVDQGTIPWLKQYPSRDAFADDLRQRLNLGENDVLIVGTRKGIAASAGRLQRDQISRALKTAGLDQANAQGGLTEALQTAIDASVLTTVNDRRADTDRSGGIIFLIFAAIAGLVGWNAFRRKKAMDAARAPIQPLRQKALDNLGYVDGYLDLLSPGADTDRARSLRQSAYDKFATATGILKAGRTPNEIAQAGPLLQNALSELEQCRASIDRATGGTGVAMKLPELPSLATEERRGRDYLNLRPVEQVPSPAERDHLRQLVQDIPTRERGVSFFSGRPLPASELVPVEIVVGGKKRTVLASREEADAIARGETPPVRAFEQNGRYIPWYEYRAYDPYRDYYGGSSTLGTLVDFYILSNLLGPGVWTGYGPWGYGGFGWGMPMPTMIYGGGGPAYYGGDYSGAPLYDDRDFGIGSDVPSYSEPEHAASFDFLGGGQDNSSNGGFDFGSSSDSSSDAGGFDFGSSDSGGGFDFGGGGDSGGGGGGDW